MKKKQCKSSLSLTFSVKSTNVLFVSVRQQVERSHLKSIQKIFECLEVVQAGRMKHPVLIQQLVHNEVHKSDLL